MVVARIATSHTAAAAAAAATTTTTTTTTSVQFCNSAPLLFILGKISYGQHQSYIQLQYIITIIVVSIFRPTSTKLQAELIRVMLSEDAAIAVYSYDEKTSK